MGAEGIFSLRYTNLAAGFMIEGSGHKLFAHDYEERGANLLMRLFSSTYGYGLNFTLNPTWGIVFATCCNWSQVAQEWV